MKNFKINNKDFWELVNQGFKVVDVRSHGEDQMTGKSFKGAINIPYPEVINNPEKYFPDKNTGIIFICNYGNRSGISASTYQKNGYSNAFVLSTGLYGLN